MTHLLGQHNVKQFRSLRIFPENGLIKIEDGRDGSCTTISVKEALLRVRALNDMIANSKHLVRQRTKDAAFYADELSQIQQLVENVVDACRIAREQGCPDDPSAVRDRNRRRPVTSIGGKTYAVAGLGRKITPQVVGGLDF